jgi:ring-1,2-phenylacetyl-CoA epoxidase subunit PaaE
VLKFHALRVLQVVPDGEDAVTLAFDVPAALHGEYRGAAGQHVVLRMDLDGQEVRRTYSMLNAPGEWPLRIAARVHSHGRMSRYLGEQLSAGAAVEVLPPNGSFTPRADARGGTYVAFAAGCGITPVMSVVRTLLAAGARSVVLFYGNTGTSRVMCAEELLALKDLNLGRLAVHFLMSREPQEVELYNGRLDADRVREFARTLFDPAAVREYFVCGPGDMIEQVSAALRGLRVSAERIHAEHFRVSAEAATAPDAPTRQAPTTGARSGLAEVSVLMDGRRRSFTMKMDDDTVLDAAARAGIELPFSCRAGVCSTCRTKVVAGAVEMLQNYALEDWELEQGYVLACQARCKSPTLELDYDEK